MYMWTSSLETGNELIDEQHKELFTAINSLINACIKLKAKDEVAKTLAFLSDYMAKHLSDEENLQITSRYPNYQDHKLLHDEFKKAMRELTKQYMTNPDDFTVINKITKTVGDWLTNHIKKEDVALAKHLATIKN